MSYLHLDGELAHGVLGGHAGLTTGLAVDLGGLEGKATTVGQLGLEALGEGLLVVSVELAEVVALSLVKDGEDASDVLAHTTDAGDLGGSVAHLLGSAELGELLLVVGELLKEVILRLITEITDAEVRHGNVFF